MLEVILIITLWSPSSNHINLESIDGFSSIEECNTFFEEWKTSLLEKDEKGNFVINNSVKVLGSCQSKRMINRKFG